MLKNGGKIDFWVTNDNKLAGRGREYEIILIDEAAFTKSPEMLHEIWPKSIKPTLLTTKGRAYVFSTPDGVDEENFFYAICNNKSLGFNLIKPGRPAGRTGERGKEQRPARVPPGVSCGVRGLVSSFAVRRAEMV